jgi:hypothetical protein
LRTTLETGKPADGVATVLFVRSVLREESDPAKIGIALRGFTRLSAQAYGNGLTVGAQARFNGPYRPVTKGGTSSKISEMLVCRPIEL